MSEYFDMMENLAKAMRDGLQISRDLMCNKCGKLPKEHYGEEVEKHGLCSRCFDKEKL